MKKKSLTRAVSHLLTLSVLGCGSKSVETSGPVGSYGILGDLSGTSVMVMPVQAVMGSASKEDVTRELEFAVSEIDLKDRWLLPTRLRQQIARSPQVQVDLDALPVGVFLQREVRRMGDPLFGQFRRLRALTDARWVFIPIVVRYEASSGAGRWELTGAVAEAGNGRVMWFGTIAAPEGPADHAGAMAALAAAVIRRLAPTATEVR